MVVPPGINTTGQPNNPATVGQRLLVVPDRPAVVHSTCISVLRQPERRRRQECHRAAPGRRPARRLPLPVAGARLLAGCRRFPPRTWGCPFLWAERTPTRGGAPEMPEPAEMARGGWCVTPRGAFGRVRRGRHRVRLSRSSRRSVASTRPCPAGARYLSRSRSHAAPRRRSPSRPRRRRGAPARPPGSRSRRPRT